MVISLFAMEMNRLEWNDHMAEGGSKSGCGVLSPFSMMALHSLLSSGAYLLNLRVTKFYPL